MYTDNIEYARGRLLHTIVRIEEEPIYIIDIYGDDGEVRCEFIYLKNGENGSEDVENINLEPVPLGYVNLNGNAFYLVRMPLRNDWRQGLRRGNVFFVGDEGFEDFPHPQLRKTILGLYPSFKDAKGYIELGGNKVAFSRDFALGKGNKLFYKQKQVGVWDKLVHLNEQFKYLTEYFQETVDA